LLFFIPVNATVPQLIAIIIENITNNIDHIDVAGEL
jgi:hypothetical protein